MRTTTTKRNRNLVSKWLSSWLQFTCCTFCIHTNICTAAGPGKGRILSLSILTEIHQANIFWCNFFKDDLVTPRFVTNCELKNIFHSLVSKNNFHVPTFIQLAKWMCQPTKHECSGRVVRWKLRHQRQNS